MEKVKNRIILRLIKMMAVFGITAPFAFCWWGYYAQQLDIPSNKIENWLAIVLFIVIYVVFAKIYDAFRISTRKIAVMVCCCTLSALFADGILYVVLWLMMRQMPNVMPWMAMLITQGLLGFVWSWSAKKWYFATFPPQKAMVIYDHPYDIEKLIREYGLDKKFDIKGTISAKDCTEDLGMLDGMETVFISGVPSHERNVILKYCVATGILVYVLPRIGDIILSGAKRIHIFHLPMLRVDSTKNNVENAVVKRCFDIVLSLVALLIASPIMLATAIAIKLDDGGPVLYKQTRLTKDGKLFNMLKFRSMRVDAERDGIARLSTGEDDDRITKVGRLIRKIRIDELPQLLNILGGSMSIVGPRPERPDIAAQYEKDLPEFRLRLQVKAGLTGYAQVYGKYNTSPYDKLQMDLMYIANPTLLEDIRIMIATIQVLFTSESTEGVAVGQTTAATCVEEDIVEAGKN